MVCYLKGDMNKIYATVKIHHFKFENISILTFGRISCVIKIFLNRQKIVKGRIFLRIPWKGRIYFCHIIGIVIWLSIPFFIWSHTGCSLPEISWLLHITLLFFMCVFRYPLYYSVTIFYQLCVFLGCGIGCVIYIFWLPFRAQ